MEPSMKIMSGGYVKIMKFMTNFKSMTLFRPGVANPNDLAGRRYKNI